MAPPKFRMKIRNSRRIAQKKRTRPIAVPDVNEEESQNSSNANLNPPVQNNRSNDNQQLSVATTKSKSRRQKMKEKNPTKYEEIRESDRKRSQLYRLEMTDAERMEYNRKAAIRQRRYRANKKAKKMEEVKEAAKKRIESGPKRVTRSEKDKVNEKKKKDADRKRAERAALTSKQYSEYLEKRRLAYAAKRDREREAKRKSSAIQTEKDDVDATTSENTTSNPVIGPTFDDQPSTSSYQPPAPSRSASAIRKRRERRSLPDDTTTYIEMLEDMLNTQSPTKVEALEKRGLRNFKANEKRRSLEQELTKIVKKQAQKPGKKDMGAILKELKVKRMQRYASKVLGINRKRIVKATKLKRGRKEITEEDIDTICNFYESMANPLPDKRLVSKHTGKPQMVLSKPVDVVFKHFQSIHPEVQIKKTKFTKLRPRHVKPSRYAKYRGCLCERCENIRMKLTVLNQRMETDGYQGLKMKDVTSLVDLTLCPKHEGTEYYQLKCIKRDCSDCGMKKFDEHFNEISENHRTSVISWREWGLITTDEGKKRRGLKNCNENRTVNNLLTELRKEVDEQALHVFNWKWQSQQYRNIKGNLPQNWVLNVWDFAENYTCFIQDEAQSAYWTRNQATVHPVVNFYHCETEGCDDLVCESIVFISSDRKHDYNAVHTYMDLVTSHLHQKRNISIKKMVRFSDGCASQYKSFGPMADVAFSGEDYNFPTCHNFYGSRHGKGASDGESAVVKSKASSAVKCGTAVIGDAKQLYEFCTSSLIKDVEKDQCTHFRRDFYYVESEDIRRNRERCQVKTINGTRALHSIQTCNKTGDAIKIRQLSCFCEACVTEDGECANSAYVSEWTEQPLIKETRKSTKSKGKFCIKLHIQISLLGGLPLLALIISSTRN